MKNEIGRSACARISSAIYEAEESGKRIDAVFMGSDLRYIIAALPDSPLRFSMERGETIYGVKVIRYDTDDLTQFYLACSYPAMEGVPANPVHRPYLRKIEER